MHSTTMATGRPLPPPGKTLPKNRPAPTTSRAPRGPAAPKAHVTSQLQCYFPALIDNDRRTHLKINRQPRRLESAISPTKQTPAPQINRQQIGTFRIAPFASRMPLRDTARSSHSTDVPRIAAALPDTNGRFHRNNNSRNSFKTNDRVNSYSIQTQTLLAAKGITAGSVSNRQSQILEITKNPTKTHNSAVLIDTKTRYLHHGRARERRGSWPADSKPRVAEQEPQTENALAVSFSRRRGATPSPYRREASHTTRITISKGLEWRHVAARSWDRPGLPALDCVLVRDRVADGAAG